MPDEVSIPEEDVRQQYLDRLARDLGSLIRDGEELSRAWIVIDETARVPVREYVAAMRRLAHCRGPF